LPSITICGVSAGVGYELLPFEISESNAMIGFPGAKIGVGSADTIALPTTNAAAAHKIDNFLTLTPGFSALQQALALTRNRGADAASDVYPVTIRQFTAAAKRNRRVHPPLRLHVSGGGLS